MRSPLASTRPRSRIPLAWWQGSTSMERAFRVAVVVCFAFGLAARLWIFTGGLGELNADEAVMGLMAMHFLEGEWSTFYWGQAYGGTLEVILLAPVVAVLGATRTALQVVPFIQSVAATALVWAVARRVVERQGAITAAALFWSFPAAFVWWQTRQSLLYLSVIVLGLIIVLCAQRIEEDPNLKLDWFVLGLAAGLGFWTSPQIVYFALPVAVWLLIKLPSSAVRVGWLVIPAFLLGASPWLITNIAKGWPSIMSLPLISDGPVARLWSWASGGLPLALGLKVPFTEEWLWPYIGPALYVVALGALTVALLLRLPPRAIHVGLLFAFPILFTLIPASASVGRGRYFFFLAPPIAVALASLPQGTRGRIILMAIATGLTALGLFQVRNVSVSFVPPVEPLVEVLDREGVDNVVAGYWVAYKLTWETEERILASPVDSNRYPPYMEEIRRAERVAYVYNLSEQSQKDNAEAMRITLNERGLAYEEIPAKGYAVIIPDEVVTPEEVPGSAIPNTVAPVGASRRSRLLVGKLLWALL